MTQATSTRPQSMEPRCVSRSVLLHGVLLVLLGAGQAVAQQSVPGGSPYPMWGQQSQPMAAPQAAQQGEVPPPGPYANPSITTQRQQGTGQGFGQRWSMPQGPAGMAMTREEFQKQQVARREAMDKRTAEMQARHQQRQPAQPQWPSAAESREATDKRMAEMRARHEARWKAIEEREKEMSKLWDQMQAREKEIRQQFEQMQKEHVQHMQAMGYGRRFAAPGAPPAAAQIPQAAQQNASPAPAPYGYAPWQRPAPYWPAR